MAHIFSDLSKESVNTMSIPELEKTLVRLKCEKRFPHLAAVIAYALTYHYYYNEKSDTKARRYYRDTIEFLDIPSGYGWCYVSVHMLAGIVMPHYLHKSVVEKAFSRLH